MQPQAGAGGRASFHPRLDALPGGTPAKGAVALRSLSLYVDRNTFVHRADPITKLLYVVVAVAVAYVAPALWPAVVFLALGLFLLAAGRVLLKAWPVFAMTLVVLSTVFIIQGLFNPANATPLLRLGPVVFYVEGLRFALGIAVRLLDLLASTVVLVLTTRPPDLIDALVRRGLSPKFGYVMSSVLQIIPNMSGATATILDAQRARGMETEGKLRTRLRAYVPLMGPLVTSSLIATQERAMALEVRAFGAKGRRTFLHEDSVPGYAGFVRWLLLAVLAATFVWRVVA